MNIGCEWALYGYFSLWKRSDVSGWHVLRREIVLDKQVKYKFPGRITHEQIVARIGTKPLKLEPTE
jgi:hypothetical protein